MPLFLKATAALDSPSQPLDEATRDVMGSRFDQDLSNVRIHTSPEAADSAKEAHALAYTVGPDIVFAPGRYQPGSAFGDALLSHELAHVVQQRSADPGSIEFGGTPDTSEVAAREAASSIAQGEPLGTLSPVGTQRVARADEQEESQIAADSKPQIRMIHGFDWTTRMGHYEEEAQNVEGAAKKAGIVELKRAERLSNTEVKKTLKEAGHRDVVVFTAHGLEDSKQDYKTTGMRQNRWTSSDTDASEIESQLKIDADPPAIVVLAGCGTTSLESNVLAGGVKVAITVRGSPGTATLDKASLALTKSLAEGNTVAQAVAAGNAILMADGWNPGQFIPTPSDPRAGYLNMTVLQLGKVGTE